MLVSEWDKPAGSKMFSAKGSICTEVGGRKQISHGECQLSASQVQLGIKGGWRGSLEVGGHLLRLAHFRDSHTSPTGFFSLLLTLSLFRRFLAQSLSVSVDSWMRYLFIVYCSRNQTRALKSAGKTLYHWVTSPPEFTYLSSLSACFKEEIFFLIQWQIIDRYLCTSGILCYQVLCWE